jgi:glyoxylase-like metal-dependent hydrolase (beta-lactamase superfamily II)
LQNCPTELPKRWWSLGVREYKEEIMGSSKGRVELIKLAVGPYDTNCYVLICPTSKESIVVDPAAEAERILREVEGNTVKYILLTHAHMDHVGALAEVREATMASLGIHPADAQHFGVAADFELKDDGILEWGDCQLRVVHTPGHTPGSVCLIVDDRVLVGDTIFPGGPGHSASPEAFKQILATLQETVFTWPDETELYPGHGAATTVGQERSAFEAFLQKPRPDRLCGDVMWE